ncbi:MAG: Unknown protein [uncultured Sulfurovum sp.]|uniref:Uncharacterized protein n=1 Tax=uncultured Sulfurovum sp. TaxID=269237 RepID=A0A6S6U5Y2_9BACT|nr:MAG: Unknown protein [uncultured Sulfurovum sp.]
MKFVGVILLLVSLFVNLKAGKVTWGENGSPSIAGTAGQGCTQNSFGLEERNATKGNCH